MRARRQWTPLTKWGKPLQCRAVHLDQQTYRTLYDDVQSYDGSDLDADVVRPWLRDQDGERRWLEAFARRGGSPVPPATVEELWRLYALSRIIDLLRPEIDLAEFASCFGLEPIAPRAFHPFFHEIVSVDPAPGRITIVKEVWPGFMIGPLLIARAGCAIAADPATIEKEVAENSTLYWAFLRPNRPTEDLSDGWGSNSQWRTVFRRDYALGGAYHYNVDAKGGGRDDQLNAEERLELLRHRCFVKCAKRHGDRWPYDDKWVEE